MAPQAKKDHTGIKVKDKLTKQELLEWANFIYSRYESSKNALNKGAERAIIKSDTNHDKLNT